MLNRLLRNQGTSPTTVYVGLATTAVTKDDTLATIDEVTTAGYARQAVTFTAPAALNDGTHDVMATENSADLTFGPLTADPPEIAFAFLTDAASGTAGTIYERWSGSVVDAPINEVIRIRAAMLKVRVTVTEI